MSVSPAFIVITSVFEPSEAVRGFAGLSQPGSGYSLLIAGDKKSPAEWNCPGADFLSAEAQSKSGFHLAARLPWNHYCRKMIGYLEAMRRGAHIIIDTDDDNLPKPGWAFPLFHGQGADTTADDLGFINAYRLFTAQFIWPRGLPLDRILDPASQLDRAFLEPASPAQPIGIWQALADGDPDVDAIYRLTNNTPCHFDDHRPVVLGRGTLCPFNSQNTAFRRETFPLLYLPALVTFRFTDILRGLVAQPILWRAGYRLGFLGATVVQVRNPHDYVKDFESEIPCYLWADRIIEIVKGALKNEPSTMADDLFRAYEALHVAKIVVAEEIKLLETWLSDIQDLNLD